MSTTEIQERQSENKELIKFLSDNNIHFEFDFNEQQKTSWIEVYKDNIAILKVDDNMPLELFKEFIIDASSEDITMSSEYYNPYWYDVYNWMQLHSLFVPIIERMK